MGFCGPLVSWWLDHCWTVLDSWVISSLGFQLELFVSLPRSEGLECVVSLKISAGFIGWKIGWLEIVKNGRFTRFKSRRGRIVGSRSLAYVSDTGSGMTLGEVTAMIGMITAWPEESGSD